MDLLRRFIAKLSAFADGMWQLASTSTQSAGEPARTLADVFPGFDQPSGREMDLEMVQQLACSSERLSDPAFTAMVDAHATFLESGGSDGRWQMLSVSGLPMCVYTGAEGRRGEQAVLRLKNIVEVEASGAWLAWADLSGCCARGADFSGANLSHAAMIDAVFDEASFEGAALCGADLSGASLTGANFRGADLAGADFEACDCTDANFEGANLEGARFPGATLETIRY